MPFRFLCLFVAATLALPGVLFAGNLNQGVDSISYSELFPDATFDSAVPTQADVTGVEPGQRPLRPEEVMDYFRVLAEVSDDAELIEYSHSYEGRPLVILAIADAETIGDLEEFRRRHVAMLDPRSDQAMTPATAQNGQAVAWLAYGIHGDELSSTDAAAAVAYRLIAGTDALARQMRSELVVLIDPCENPDGRARYLAQTLSFAHRTASPDQDDLSHTAVWPWGRGNHYLFDLNRDWFTMVHPESQRSVVIASWLPQMLVDSHEMGANGTYLFPPPRHPFNPFLPQNTKKWELSFSDDQAHALDERGYPYYTGEWNEEFFPGYGSSWASYHGSIGILYEMSRTTGTLVRKRGGTVRTFAQAIDHHTTSSMANLTSLLNHRAEVLADHAAARGQAVQEGRSGDLKAWIFPADGRHPERLADLAQMLSDQGIEVQYLTREPAKAGELRDARTGEKTSRELPVGSLLVRMDQPAGYLARAILDPHVPMESSFLQEQREYLEKGKGSRLYETTAWSVALGAGVPAFWSGKVPGGDWRAWSVGAVPRADLKAAPVPAQFTSLILDGDRDAAPLVLADLLQGGVRVRTSDRAFTVEGQSFHPGALVIRREGNVEDVAQQVRRSAARHGLTVHAVGTSRAENGPYLGAAQYRSLVAPRVGVLTGSPISPTAYGAVWHLLDQDLDLRFSALDIGRLGRVDLSRYNVLVFPSVFGGVSAYREAIGERGMKRIVSWIRAGGTAIGLGGGARLLAHPETALTQTRFRDQVVLRHPSPVWSLTAAEVEAAGRPAATGLRATSAPTPGTEAPAAEPVEMRANLYDVAPILGPGAAPFAAGHDQGKPLDTPPVPMGDWIKHRLPAGALSPEESPLPAADARLRRFMPQGAMLNVDLDPEFWLNWGLEDRIGVWFGGDDPLIAESGVRVAARFPDMDELHLGGLLWPEAAARLAHTGYATQESVGRGQVVLFAQNPAYRRWMKDTERMLMNAILMGPGLGTRWSSPW